MSLDSQSYANSGFSHSLEIGGKIKRAKEKKNSWKIQNKDVLDDKQKKPNHVIIKSE